MNRLKWVDVKGDFSFLCLFVKGKMEIKIRSFIAIELDSHVLKVITSFSNRIQARFPSGFRWVKPELLHLTLKFLGDISKNQVEQISLKLGELCSGTEPFNLQIDGTGAFPSWRNPRTVWVGIQPSQPLCDLHRHLESELEEVGIRAEGRSFSAHLTLCRVSENVDPMIVRQLENLLCSIPLSDNLVWMVKEVVFYKSILQPGGPIYSVITRHEL